MQHVRACTRAFVRESRTCREVIDSLPKKAMLELRFGTEQRKYIRSKLREQLAQRDCGMRSKMSIRGNHSSYSWNVA